MIQETSDRPLAMQGAHSRTEQAARSPAARRLASWRYFPDVLCGLFAAWTLLSHLTVMAQGGLRQLLWNSLVCVIGAILLGLLRWRHRQQREEQPQIDKNFGRARPHEPRFVGRFGKSIRASLQRRQLRSLRWLSLAALASAAVILIFGLSVTSLWLLLVLFLALALFHEELTPARPLRTVTFTQRQDGLIWLLIGLTILIALTLKKPDLDDTFYVNLAVTAADYPDLPLLCCDSLHGRPDGEINFPSQRLRSLELLAGGLAFLSGIEPIVWSHYLFPVIGALLFVTAYARLLPLLVLNAG